MKTRTHPNNLRQQVALEQKRRNVVFFTLIIIAFIYIGTTLLFGEMGFIKYLHLKKIRNSLDAEIATMTKDKVKMKEQVNALKNDTFSIEKNAREEYGMAKPDEYIFQFNENGR